MSGSVTPTANGPLSLSGFIYPVALSSTSQLICQVPSRLSPNNVLNPPASPAPLYTLI